MTYVPSLPANAVHLAIFALLLLTQIFLGVCQRTWGFLRDMFGWLLFEVLRFIGRVQMHSTPFIDEYVSCTLAHALPPQMHMSRLLMKQQVSRLPTHRSSLPLSLNLPLSRK